MCTGWDQCGWRKAVGRGCYSYWKKVHHLARFERSSMKRLGNTGVDLNMAFIGSKDRPWQHGNGLIFVNSCDRYRTDSHLNG